MTFESALIFILTIYSIGATYFLVKTVELINELRIELNKIKIDLLHK